MTSLNVSKIEGTSNTGSDEYLIVFPNGDTETLRSPLFSSHSEKEEFILAGILLGAAKMWLTKAAQ